MSRSGRRRRRYYDYNYARKVHMQTNNWIRENIRDPKKSVCEYCFIPLNKKNRSLDHKHPKSRGGGTTMSNMAACCLPCNRKKGNMTWEEWVKQLNGQKPPPPNLSRS